MNINKLQQNKSLRLRFIIELKVYFHFLIATLVNRSSISFDIYRFRVGKGVIRLQTYIKKLCNLQNPEI